MALTKGKLSGLATRSVQNVDTSVGVEFLINLAGQTLTVARQWRWLWRGPSSFSFVAGQSYVDLPSDLEAVIAVTTTQRLGARVNWIDINRLAQLRNASPNEATVGEYYGAVIFTGTGSLGPRLELYPTPPADLADAGSIYYRAQWHEILDSDPDSTEIQIPTWVEPLYLQVFNAVVKGYEEEDVANVASRTAGLFDSRSNPMYKSTVFRDAKIIPDWGPIQGGAIGRDNVDFEFITGDLIVES